MEQMEMLWQYQQADVAVDALETEIKRDPARLALKKNREFLVEQQNAVKKMEEEVAQMVDRVDVMRQGGRAYVRVVDYKTGTKQFRPLPGWRSSWPR